MSRGLVIGESLIDICRTADSQRRARRGSPLNVAGRLAGWGATCLPHPIADDPYGRRIASTFQCAGAQTCFGKPECRPDTTAAELRRKRVGQLSVRSGLAAFR